MEITHVLPSTNSGVQTQACFYLVSYTCGLYIKGLYINGIEKYHCFYSFVMLWQVLMNV